MATNDTAGGNPEDEPETPSSARASPPPEDVNMEPAASTGLELALIPVKLEPTASAAERFATGCSAKPLPDAKRARANTRPSTPETADMESVGYQSLEEAPRTPQGAGHGSVNRADMSAAMDDLFQKMVRLMEPRHQEIQQSVATAIQPLQSDLEAMGLRLSALEKRFQDENAEGDQQWPGWKNYGDEDHPAWHKEEWHEDESQPAAPTWAQRAAKHAKGDGKGAKGAKSAAKGKDTAAARAAAPNKLNPSKIRISTLNGNRVKIADLKQVVLAFIAETAADAEVIINGSVFGKAYTATFRASSEEGATLVKNCLAALKVPEGGYRKLWCPSPVDGQEAIQLFLNTDKAPAQMAREYQFRTLKRCVKAVHDEPNYMCDPRDQLMSLAFRPIVQILPNKNTEGYRVVWHHAAMDLFTPVQQEEVSLAFATAVTSEASRG